MLSRSRFQRPRAALPIIVGSLLIAGCATPSVEYVPETAYDNDAQTFATPLKKGEILYGLTLSQVILIPASGGIATTDGGVACSDEHLDLCLKAKTVSVTSYVPNNATYVVRKDSHLHLGKTMLQSSAPSDLEIRILSEVRVNSSDDTQKTLIAIGTAAAAAVPLGNAAIAAGMLAAGVAGYVPLADLINALPGPFGAQQAAKLAADQKKADDEVKEKARKERVGVPDPAMCDNDNKQGKSAKRDKPSVSTGAQGVPIETILRNKIDVAAVTRGASLKASSSPCWRPLPEGIGEWSTGVKEDSPWLYRFVEVDSAGLGAQVHNRSDSIPDRLNGTGILPVARCINVRMEIAWSSFPSAAKRDAWLKSSTTGPKQIDVLDANGKLTIAMDYLLPSIKSKVIAVADPDFLVDLALPKNGTATLAACGGNIGDAFASNDSPAAVAQMVQIGAAFKKAEVDKKTTAAAAAKPK